MSWTIELTLNTDTQRFESWLERYRLATLPDIFELENEKTLHVIGAPTFRRQQQGLRIHAIDASVGKPSSMDPKGLEMSFQFPVLEVGIFEPADNRINAKIECRHQALVPYHIRMLGEIAKLWPETGKSILAYLKQFVPTDETNMQTIMVKPEGFKEFHTVIKKGLNIAEDRLLKVLKDNFYMSIRATGESIDIHSPIASSGRADNVDYYHIYVQGQINGTTVRNLIFLELRGRLGEDSDTGFTAYYLDREPALEKFVNMIFHKSQLVGLAELADPRATIEEVNDPRQRGQSGRPKFSEDLWAWEQVNQHSRPMNEVYKEWFNKIQANPKRCNMIDPKRQFNRVTKPKWGNKSGQNI